MSCNICLPINRLEASFGDFRNRLRACLSSFSKAHSPVEVFPRLPNTSQPKRRKETKHQFSLDSNLLLSTGIRRIRKWNSREGEILLSLRLFHS
jgi:hypothetical protein